MSCVVLLVVIYFIGAVSCCSTDKDCGFNITIYNRIISFPSVCCKYVSPRRCTNHQKCLVDSKNSTSKPNNTTPRPNLQWTPSRYNIPRRTVRTLTLYKPMTTSYEDYEDDDGYGSSSSNDDSDPPPFVIIILIVILMIIVLILRIYRYCVSQALADRQSSQNVTGQREVTRNPHHTVRVISEDVRGSSVSQVLVDEHLPSYADVVTPSPPQYNDLPPPRRHEDNHLPPPTRHEDGHLPPPPRYEDNHLPPPTRHEDNHLPPPTKYEDDHLPPPPRYEDNHLPPPTRYEDDHLPPPPRYEDVVNEDNAATSGENTATPDRVSLV